MPQSLATLVPSNRFGKTAMSSKLVRVALKLSTWMEILMGLLRYVAKFDKSQLNGPTDDENRS